MVDICRYIYTSVYISVISKFLLFCAVGILSLFVGLRCDHYRSTEEDYLGYKTIGSGKVGLPA